MSITYQTHTHNNTFLCRTLIYVIVFLSFLVSICGSFSWRCSSHEEQEPSFLPHTDSNHRHHDQCGSKALVGP